MRYITSDPSSLQKFSEEVLTKLALEGIEDAFAELVRRARDRCLGTACGILRNRDDARDVVQSAFIQAYIHLNTFNRQAKFSTWVNRIVINHCYMSFRSSRTRPVARPLIDRAGETVTGYEPVDSATPESWLGLAEVQNLVRTEVGRLPTLLRRPLELYYLEELPVDVVAHRLGLTTSAAKSRIHRAQRFLRERMTRHCGRTGPATLMQPA